MTSPLVRKPAAFICALVLGSTIYGFAQTAEQAGEKWQKIQEGVYARTDGARQGSGFHTWVVSNLPESDIVGAPQSVVHDVEGNCKTRTYTVLGSLFYEGKNRSGSPVESLPPQGVERKVIPGSPIEKVFNLLCK